MADQLFEEWRVYEKLLIHDYMDHRAFFGRLAGEIDNRFDRPVRILDLGCGDLKPIRPLLAEARPDQYVGIDESEVALAIARDRLDEDETAGRLIRGDLRKVLTELDGPFDVIVASFSLHHLADPLEKQAVYADCASLLAADGFLAVIDVFCEPEESRDAYLDRWIRHADARYAQLEPAEKQFLFEHVRARDYPVSVVQCRALGEAAGLPGFAVLLEDAPRLNRLVTLSRADS
ncbi:class I SAM-dependent methyltransferase [Elongatibacter sediminis]|uniref:Class I SAM-dependent methyltransferase n=1 Tax=Elongatibacter sediminis TaxID=3119006 RepID=A0AAW9RBR8_9GAMM